MTKIAPFSQGALSLTKSKPCLALADTALSFTTNHDEKNTGCMMMIKAFGHIPIVAPFSQDAVSVGRDTAGTSEFPFRHIQCRFEQRIGMGV